MPFGQAIDRLLMIHGEQLIIDKRTEINISYPYLMFSMLITQHLLEGLTNSAWFNRTDIYKGH